MLCLLDVGKAGSSGFDLVFVSDEFRDGVVLSGEESVTCRCWHLDGEAEVTGGDGQGFDVDLHLEGGIGCGGSFERVDVGLGCGDTGEAEGGGVSVEDLREGFSDDSGEAIFSKRLGGVLTGGATAEVDAGDEDGGILEALVIERVVGLFAGHGIEADVVEGELAESIKGDALHEACGDDAVGVDIGSGDGDGGSGNLSDGCDGHDAIICEGYLKAGVMV
jgi:hypothetical protein